jgi:hypothetical protein
MAQAPGIAQPGSSQIPGTPSANPAPTHRPPPAPSTRRYGSETDAKKACGDDTVVWVNTGGSKVWHVSGDKYYGKTRRGAYLCQHAAQQSGYRAAKQT